MSERSSGRSSRQERLSVPRPPSRHSRASSEIVQDFRRMPREQLNQLIYSRSPTPLSSSNSSDGVMIGGGIDGPQDPPSRFGNQIIMSQPNYNPQPTWHRPPSRELEIWQDTPLPHTYSELTLPDYSSQYRPEGMPDEPLPGYGWAEESRRYQFPGPRAPWQQLSQQDSRLSQQEGSEPRPRRRFSFENMVSGVQSTGRRVSNAIRNSASIETLRNLARTRRGSSSAEPSSPETPRRRRRRDGERRDGRDGGRRSGREGERRSGERR